MASLLTTVSSQGQIFLPQALRQRYGIKPGDKLMFLPGDSSVSLRPIPARLSLASHGMLKKEVKKSGGVIRAHRRWKSEWQEKP